MAGFTLNDMKKFAKSGKAKKGTQRDRLYRGREGNEKDSNIVLYRVWDNLIAVYNYKTKQLTIKDAGYRTNLTKDRLNGVIPRGKGKIAQKKFKWYIGKQEWKGSKVYKRV